MTTKKPKTTAPPPHLSADARKFWTSIHADFVVDDGAGLALLRAAAEAFDRAQDARKLIEKDGGPVLTDRFGQRKPHPAVAIERDARGQLVSAIRALRLGPGE